MSLSFIHIFGNVCKWRHWRYWIRHWRHYRHWIRHWIYSLVGFYMHIPKQNQFMIINKRINMYSHVLTSLNIRKYWRECILVQNYFSTFDSKLICWEMEFTNYKCLDVIIEVLMPFDIFYPSLSPISHKWNAIIVGAIIRNTSKIHMIVWKSENGEREQTYLKNVFSPFLDSQFFILQYGIFLNFSQFFSIFLNFSWKVTSCIQFDSNQFVSFIYFVWHRSTWFDISRQFMSFILLRSIAFSTVQSHSVQCSVQLEKRAHSKIRKNTKKYKNINSAMQKPKGKNLEWFFGILLSLPTFLLPPFFSKSDIFTSIHFYSF